MSAREYRSAVKGNSIKLRLASAVDRCMRKAGSREEFIRLMAKYGWQVRWEEARKHITYIYKSGWKCRDDKLHEEKYLKERMVREFEYRKAAVYGGAEIAERSPGVRRGAPGTAGSLPSHGGGVGASDGAGGVSLSGGGGASAAGVPAAVPLSGASADGEAGGIHGASAMGGGTGWEAEREIFLSAQAESAHSVSAGVGRTHGGGPGNGGGGAGVAEALLGLGRALERTQDQEPVRGDATAHRHGDRKQLAKERRKKIAQGHAADDHEDDSMSYHM